MLRSWKEEDWPTLDNEKAIMKNWQIHLTQGPHKQDHSESNTQKQVTWKPPPKHTFKLNFDGASKGNPGLAGFGGIIRNHEGEPLILYYGNIGWDTNNSAELEGLWQGLLLAGGHNFHSLEVEGDSQILINMAKNILNGSHAKKIATSWRLEARLEAIELELHRNRAITFTHIKREGNKVADFMANVGVENDHSLITGQLNTILTHDKAQECSHLVQKDAIPPDAGVR